MNYIKDNWVDTDTFHASDLNEIASVVNELSEKQSSIINDEDAGDASTYSSNKINEIIGESQGQIIDDEQPSESTAYSSSKIDEKTEYASFKAVVVDNLPDVGESNTIYFTPSKNAANPVISGYCEMYAEQDLIHVNPFSEEPEKIDVEVGDVFRYNKPSGVEYPRIILSSIDKTDILISDNGESRDGFFVTGNISTIELQNGHYYKLKERYTLRGLNCGGMLFQWLFVEGYGMEYLIYEEISNPGEGNYKNVEFFPCASILEDVPYRDFWSMDNPMISIDSGATKIYQLVPVEGFNSGLKRTLQVGDTIKVTGENTGYDGFKFVCITEVRDDILALTDESGDERGMFDGIISSKEWQKNEYYRFTGMHGALLPYDVNDNSDDLIYGYVIPTFEQITDVEEADYEATALPGVIMRLSHHTQIKDKWIWVDNDWMLLSGPSDESN